MRSIRAHLAMSAPHDATETAIKTNPFESVSPPTLTAVVELFKQNLEAVDGHCIIVRDDAEVAAAVNRIAEGRSIATSDAPPRPKVLSGFVLELPPHQPA